MTDYSYAVTPLRLTGNPALTEASKEELRVLLLLIELGGRVESVTDMAKAAGISEARCKSALAFWEESEVITARDGDNPAIIQEFEEKLRPGEIDEVESVKVAESIRKENLASMLEECANLFGIACLSQANVKSLTALNTQYGLSPEYIVTLASHIASSVSDGCKLTVRRLCNEAIRLANNGCDTVEMLDLYIEKKNSTPAYEWEYKRAIGIYGKISKAQQNYFRIWNDDFGFSPAIVSEAYEIALNNTDIGSNKFPYMHSILETWHKGGCKTVAECKAYSEANKPAKAAKRASKTDAPTPRYGNFDVNDAFKKALERSYGENED